MPIQSRPLAFYIQSEYARDSDVDSGNEQMQVAKTLYQNL